MRDGLGRNIDYLRISVTDKCNLRCKYCMPPQGILPVSHEEILTLEEVFRLVGIMEQLGIRKVRLTGGEPMVRKNLPWLVEQIHGLSGIREIAMTTNGTMFAPQAEMYRSAGLTAVNISLDTLDPERFRCITGCDRADRAAGVDSVLRAIDAALEQQLKVKINCVPCVEMNGEDIEGIAMLAEDRPVDVRFIELMPIGCGKNYTGISSEEILRRLEQHFGKAIAIPEKVNMETGRLTENFARKTSNPVDNSDRRTDGPAEYYQFPGFSGRIGFISPISHKFCRECNRVRLTCEGRLKLCLHYDRGLELKPLLRSGASDEEIGRQIINALKEKPSEHHFREKAAGEELPGGVEEQRKMVQIGG